MDRPIGVFDSGIGGLTVVKELIKSLPREDLVYFGDTARVPYGTKAKDTVIRFSLEDALFLLKKKVKLIVVACNTASSLALPSLKRNFRIPIIGVIKPGVKEAVNSTKNKKIGIIATASTIKSGAYHKELKRLNARIRVVERACPLFVPLVEEGWLNGKSSFEIAKKYLRPLKSAKIDTLILGCTHYPLLKPLIRKIMGSSVNLIDSARQVADEVKDILSKEGLATPGKKKGRYSFFVSDEPAAFARLSKSFLGHKLSSVKKHSL